MNSRGGLWPVMVGFGLVVVIGFLTARAGNRELILQLNGATMGTTYAVRIVVGSPASLDSALIHDTVQTVLDRFEAIASTYDAESELSRFNQRSDTLHHEVSGSLAAVFRVARRVSERSAGALDITVGPLVDIWGFGPGESFPPKVPDSAVIDSLLAHVGYRQLSVDSVTATIGKRNASVTADLSAIAKGYGVDIVARALSELGYERFMIEIGGEVIGRGSRNGGGPWKVGIERPDPVLRSLGLIIDVQDQAVATSGDYRNYLTLEGVRYSHIIDPRTGRPLPFLPASVTVVHSSAAEADAWATALFVLGEEAGIATADREGLAVLFQRYDGDEIVLRRSSAFPATSRVRGTDCIVSARSNPQLTARGTACRAVSAASETRAAAR